MGATDEMLGIALQTQPDYVTLVPEKREEVTTEGGLNVAGQQERMNLVVDKLQSAGIPVSLFIDPDSEQIQASAKTGAKFIELHTGRYAEAKDPTEVAKELEALKQGCEEALAANLRVNAGHGLTYWNTRPVALLPGMEELNIGHSIISRAVLVGIERAVREMKDVMHGRA